MAEKSSRAPQWKPKWSFWPGHPQISRFLDLHSGSCRFPQWVSRLSTVGVLAVVLDPFYHLNFLMADLSKLLQGHVLPITRHSVRSL